MCVLWSWHCIGDWEGAEETAVWLGVVEIPLKLAYVTRYHKGTAILRLDHLTNLLQCMLCG